MYEDRDLANCFSRGTAGVMCDGKLTKVPSNEDWSMIGKVVAYDAAIGKLTLSKIHDTSASSKLYYVWYRYNGQSGSPSSAEVEVGQLVPFFRAGPGNADFSSVPTQFAAESGNINDPSFGSFFFTG